MRTSTTHANPRYWIIVPAAGIGARMSSTIPKQYLTLAGKTLLEQTLERLLKLPFIQRVILVLHPRDGWWEKLAMKDDPRIQIVNGGDQRSQSVFNALQDLAELADENDWILVHDAARPCVTLASIENLRAQTSKHSVGGILGVPVSDTLKTVAEQQILATVDRDQLWQAQTPQMFRYGLLHSCLARALRESKSITDEASALEAYGHRPLMITGRSDNIKITRPEDLVLAQWILQHQSQEQEQHS